MREAAPKKTLKPAKKREAWAHLHNAISD